MDIGTGIWWYSSFLCHRETLSLFASHVLATPELVGETCFDATYLKVLTSNDVFNVLFLSI